MYKYLCIYIYGLEWNLGEGGAGRGEVLDDERPDRARHLVWGLTFQDAV